MISDSIPTASIASASSKPKDFAKKKRANRSAKLKQCKLDARREQWLSQVKNKSGCKEESYGGGDTPRGHRGMPIEKLVIKPGGEDEIYGDGSPMHHHYTDFEFFPSNSVTSHTSSVLGSNDSVINFTASSRSSTSSGRSSNCFCSEEDEGDDGCLDDWEALADALDATDKKQQEHNNNVTTNSEKHENPEKHENDISTSADQESGGKAVVNFRAWRPDDAFRPLSLPNLAKQYSFPLNSERHFGRVVPTSCPICCEDLDGTDSSFIPCPCGFRLCLFCHKRILEEDGRCPGCRKEYGCEDSVVVEGEGGPKFRFARSCSMVTRS